MRATFRGLCVLAVVVGLQGCGATTEEIAGWKVAMNTVAEEMSLIERDLMIVEDPVLRAKLQANWSAMRVQVDRINDKIQSAESGADLVDTLLTAGGAAFPPLGVAAVFYRAWRRRTKQRDEVVGQRDTVFKSVDAGGGVKNPQRARAVLTAHPTAYLAYKEHEAKNGAPAVAA